MITRCCVIGCKNSTHDRKGKRLDNGVQFFNIPAWRQDDGEQTSELTKRRRMAWVSAIRQPDITLNSTAKHFVCSQHFVTGKPADETLDSDTDWTPTLRLGHTEGEASRRNAKRRTTKLQPVNCTASAAPQTPPEVDKVLPQPPSTTCDESHAAIQVAPAEPEVDDTEEPEYNGCNLGRDDISRLLGDYRAAKKDLSQKVFDEQYFKDNDARVKYYTGLPSFPMLNAVLSVVAHFLESDRKLSKFQKLILTLIRLRLDWPTVHLAHMFRIHPKAAENIFKDTIDILFFSELRDCVFWPDRDAIFQTMPREFEEALGKQGYSVIVDVLEIKTEIPTDTNARYKHKSQKFLLAIAPFGVISYVSKGCGGVIDDMTLTSISGLLQRLQPGDLVLAARGFKFRESVGMMFAEVSAPDETGHVSMNYVDSSIRMQELRRPVQMLVENVRNKFTMLSHKIPARYVLECEDEGCTWLDKIVRVCCIMTQMWTCHNSLLTTIKSIQEDKGINLIRLRKSR